MMQEHPVTQLILTPCNADNGDKAGIFARQMHFLKAGDQMPGHLHNYDHPTLFAKGAFDVDVDGIVQHVIAPHMMLIRKDRKHTITATEDDSLAFCIHIVRDADGEIAGPGQLHMYEILKRMTHPG